MKKYTSTRDYEDDYYKLPSIKISVFLLLYLKSIRIFICVLIMNLNREFQGSGVLGFWGFGVLGVFLV
jgi:hypothetical protein